MSVFFFLFFVTFAPKYGPCHAKTFFGHIQTEGPHLPVQSNQDLCCLQTESLDTAEYSMERKCLDEMCMRRMM